MIARRGKPAGWLGWLLGALPCAAACDGEPAAPPPAATSTATQAGRSPGTAEVPVACACLQTGDCPEVQVGGVPYLPASPPGSWDLQANSGLAAALAVIGHLQGFQPTAADIEQAQQWLAKRSAGGWQVRDGNGDPAGVTTLQLVALATTYDLGASPRALPGCEYLADDLLANRPLVVLVEAQGPHPYPATAFRPGPPQFMVLVGVDAQHAYVYDPAQPDATDACGPDCAGRAYDLGDFAAAWARHGNMVVRIAHPMR